MGDNLMTTNCYLCREPMRSPIMRALWATVGENGWTLICIPCAIEHRLDGRLLASKNDPDVTRWLHFQEERDMRS